ncbi:MAG: hypothetical protein WCT03_16690 [Candidatus Obscuribacterales bacterium]|jgi:hypothetical protein
MLPASQTFLVMKSASIFEQIGFPQVVEFADMPALGGQVAVYEDGSVFNEKTGDLFTPQQDDSKFWNMRQEFDKRNYISPTDRILTANRERSAAIKGGFYC